MKNLIIHPKDESTIFLCGIYENIPNKTVITGGITKQELNVLIDKHDRVLMMGHGSPDGLFSINQFKVNPIWRKKDRYIIDYETVELLSRKDNSVFIWCNADQFVEYYGLKGFYTGMFVSETSEADFCGVYGTNQELIDESNYGFVELIKNYINDDKETIHKAIKHDYGIIAEENPVALYNNNRLYFQ